MDYRALPNNTCSRHTPHIASSTWPYMLDSVTKHVDVPATPFTCRWKIFRHMVAVIAPLMTDEELQQYNINPTNDGLLPLGTCEHVLV